MLKNGVSIKAWALAVLFYPASLQAQDDNRSVHVVYEDQYITVRSSIDAFEGNTFTLGDILTLKIGVEYDSERVRVVNLDESLLTTAWGQTAWMYVPDEPPRVFHETGNGISRSEAEYTFQVIGCPGEEIPCPGGKVYQLPELSLSIEILGEDAGIVSATDVPFRPWPNYVPLASALPLLSGNIQPFNFYFPNRALGMPISINIDHQYVFMILALVALLTSISVAFAPVVKIWARRNISSRSRILGTRWERVLDRLHDESLQEEEFWEGVRTVITWYSHDLFNENIMQWLIRRGNGDPGQTISERLKELLEESARGEKISHVRRQEVLKILVESLEQI